MCWSLRCRCTGEQTHVGTDEVGVVVDQEVLLEQD